MADFNDLPNDHKSVTPDWKPYRFPRTPFSDLFNLQRLPAQDGSDSTATFTGSVPPYYCSFAGRIPAVHGGVSAALSIKAAQLYHQDLHKLDKPLQPLTQHIEFLKTGHAGPFRVSVKPLTVGGRQAAFQVTLELAGPDGKQLQKGVSATSFVRLGKLKPSASSRGPFKPGAVVGDIVEAYQKALPDMPDKKTECARWAPGMYFAINPVVASMRLWMPNDLGHQFYSGKHGGPDTRYTWFKPDDGSRFQQEHVTVITDLVGGIPLNFEKDGDKALFERAMPTMSTHLTFRADVTGEEFLLCKAQMKKLQNGWFDMDMLVLNEAGEIVATCVHTVSYIPIKKPEKKGAANKGGKKESKI